MTMKRICIAVALLLVFSSPAFCQEKILAMGYLGFRDAAATAENFQKLADAGLDMLTLEMDQSSAGLQMDLAREAGIKILAVLAPYTDHKNINV